MSQDVDITEVSDPQDMTIDAPVDTSVPEIRILKGNPTDEELAALVTVLAGGSGGAAEHGPQELNLWGHPVDKLRYSVVSWQRVTQLERTHIRR
ncbi:acyl-CoA carboxylase subunit epsilon [Mycolicibacterium hodleri]|uniref:Acyl-CoA carboxylase subunit epsilon n=1 Tax=Mycolicibacterium hodleri TaxID=49897 RepID=A0A502EDH2_9MYCO|nr:acyl-CoA carboxylase subunit epsilon [Mycolicibacterium hodleri]TPG34546.1 acyl-CoA carboxylase subunit epsilon [Mycolicibacterium hodleri]